MMGKRRIKRRSTGRTVAIVLVGLVAVAAIGVGSFLLLTDRNATEAGPTDTTITATATMAPVADPKPLVPRLAIAPIANSEMAPTAAGIGAALAPVLADKNLANFAGEVIDPASGTVLWKKDPGSSQIPASTAKLLTGAALLTSVKDPNSRLTTTVVKGDQAGDIVFVGGGDVTLSARPTGVGTVYDGAPTVTDLAAQVKASGVEVKRIVLDSSYWTGPDFANGWKSEDVKGTSQSKQGYITRMSALMVDGDRDDPAKEDSTRSGEPAKTAGRALARALGNADLPLIDGTAPPSSQVIASVQSQPLSILLSQAMVNSDNVLAEALAREVAGAKGAPRSFEGASAATLLALEDLKIDTINVQLYDGSGLSENDRVTPDILAQVLSLAIGGKRPALRYLLTGLPVAGVSGTLTSVFPNFRFDDARSKAGAGWVRAKTGSLNSTYVLAGYTPDVDGRLLVFSVVSNASIPDPNSGTRSVQDAFAATLRQCGCQG